MPIFSRFSLRIDGVEELKQYALQVRANADDLRPAFQVILANLRKLQRRVFDTEGGALGPVWLPLTDKTVAARRGRWGHYAQPPQGERPRRRILHWTHALRRSLLDEGAEGSVASVSASTLVYGTTIPYAAPNNARRRFFEFTDAFITTEVMQPLQQYLLGRAPTLGRGQRRTRRVGGVANPIAFSEAAD